MKHKRAIIFALIAAALLLPLPTLLKTEAGLNWVFQLVSRYIPGELSVVSLRGSISSPILIDELIYRNGDLQLEVQRGELVWQPWQLLSGMLKVKRLQLDGINIHTAPGDTHSETKTVATLPDIRIPFRFDLNDILLNNVSIQAGDSDALKITELHLSTNSHRGFIVIPWLMLDMPDYSLNISGKLKPREHYPLEANGSFTLKQLFAQPFVVDAQLTGDLTRLQTIASVKGFIQGEVTGQLLDVATDLHWDADAVVNQFGLNSISETLPANNIQGVLHSQGSLQNINLKGNASTQYVDWGKALADYDLDLSLVNNELIINNLVVQEKNHPARINSQGSINWSGEDVFYKLAARWQQLGWPWRENAVYKSPEGSLNFNGVLSAYDLNLDADLEAENYPPTQVTAETKGNLQQLQFNKLELDTMQGKVSGQGLLRWQDFLQWQADLQLSQLNPEFFLKNQQAILSARVKSDGNLKDSKLHTDVIVTDIAGEFQKNPLSGSAKISVSDSDIAIHQFDLKLNGSDVLLKGEISETLALDYNIHSENLSSILPELHGKITAKGKVTGSRNLPDLTLNLKASKLQYLNYAVAELNTVADVSLDPDKILKLDFSAADIAIGDQLISNLKLKGDGTLAQHRLDISAQQLKTSLDFILAGGVSDKLWQGKLIDSNFKDEHLGEWRVEQSSALVVGEKYLQLEKNCYVQQQTDLCFQIDTVDGAFNADFSWENLAIARFEYWIPPEIKVRTFFNGQAKLNLVNEELSASAEFRNTAGEVVVRTKGGDRQVQFQAGEILLDWTPGEIKSSINIPLEQEAVVSAEIALNKSQANLPLAQWPMQGNVDMQLPTLVFVAPYIPMIKNIEQAEAKAKFGIAGTLLQPAIVGESTVSAPLLLVPDLNMTLKNSVVSVKINENNKISFSGDADSGDGKIHISGESQLEEWRIKTAHAAIRGKQFVVTDLPQATVQVSPQLLVQFQNNKVSVEGDVTIPYARLRPVKLPVGTVTESSDLVIVGAEVHSEETASQLAIEAKVRVILGDRVSFDGFGLRSRLTGSLQLIDKPDEVTIGRGEIILVDGFYRYFGQELQISKGRLIFANTPVDDPGLDISAQRVYSDVTVGVNVTSTLRKPDVRLFSVPVMPEADTLSYLLLGRPMRQANESEGTQLAAAATAMGLAGSELLARNIGNRLGIEEIMIETNTDTGTSSLVIGRYLSPKLYIRYFTGIFERSNIVQLRYNVSKKVLLQTETGSQMGADIFYTIEH